MDLILIKRYLCGKNRIFPRTTHLLSLIGITIGVTALLIVSSVMNGFEQDMMRRVIGSRAEIRLTTADREPITDYPDLISGIEKRPEILNVSPVISNELLAYKGDAVAVINAFGIDYKKHNELIELEEQIRLGVPEIPEFEEEGIIIGLDLSLALRATIGEYIQLTSPINSKPSPLGMIPRVRRFKVLGIFVSGMPEYDKTYAYISLENGRYFADLAEGVSLLQIKTTNPQRSRRYASTLQRELGDGYQVEDWSQFDASLFKAMQLEKGVMFSVLVLMLVISGFNMAGNSLKTVTEKKNEIGILKALGMKTGRIDRFFIGVNLSVGLLGILLGGLISVLFLYLQYNYQLIYIPVPGFPIHWLPVEVRLADFLVVPAIVLIISFSSTIIALQKIRDILPIKVIRELD